jgi:hypothetical protein
MSDPRSADAAAVTEDLPQNVVDPSVIRSKYFDSKADRARTVRATFSGDAKSVRPDFLDKFEMT